MRIDTRRLRRKAQKALYTRSLIDFHEAAWSQIDPAVYVPGRHLSVIAEHLQAVSEGRIKRLLINVPFRTSKSSLISVSWPAWDWIKRPSRQWFTLSYGERLAIRDNRKMRAVVQSDWYQSFWPLTFASDQDEKKNFINDKKGRRQCAGLDSGVVGDGGDIVMIDDPMDRDQAESDSQREDLLASFDEKIYSRLNDQVNGAFVVIGQRLHERDLFGYLLKDSTWEHLCLPMRYEVDHPTPSRTSLGGGEWRTQDGELLWPARFPESVVIDLETRLGSYGSAGQLQQRPQGRKGLLFERQWFEIVPSCPANVDKVVRYWDQAASEKKKSDESAGVLVATKGDITYVVDVRSGRWNPTARKEQQRAAAISDESSFKNHVELWEEEEGGSTGKETAQAHREEFREWGLRTDRPTGSKETRAMLVVPDAENGKIKLVAGAWNGKFLDQVCGFPKASHDDIVDGFSGAYAKARIRKRWVYAGAQQQEKKDGGEDKRDESAISDVVGASG